MMNPSSTGDSPTRPSERIREAFLSQLEGLGVEYDRIPGTEIYRIDGQNGGLIYLKIRSSGKPFFGIRHEFMKTLLGDIPGIITPSEREYLIFLLSENPKSGVKPPKSWKLKSTVLRHLLLMAQRDRPWACVLLIGRDDRWVSDGWILTPVHVANGLRQWSFSEHQGEYKINEPDLRHVNRHLGLQAIASAAIQALQATKGPTASS